MDRRQFNRTLTLAAVALATPAGRSQTISAAQEAAAPGPGVHDPMMEVMKRFVDDLAQGDRDAAALIFPAAPRRIAMLAYPGMFPLDLLGPKAIFEDLLNTHVHLVWKNRQPIAVGRGVHLVPDRTLEDCPENLDVIFVPGGAMETIALMRDPEVLDYLRRQARTARYVTSVCTGALVLGAAGLLRGHRATTHWLTLDLLSSLGATPVRARVVEDRNRITGAGVTAGLDFALLLVARLAGEAYAKAEQLNLEYDPAPPFTAGSPAGAGEVVSGALSRMYSFVTEAARANALAAAQEMK